MAPRKRGMRNVGTMPGSFDSGGVSVDATATRIRRREDSSVAGSAQAPADGRRAEQADDVQRTDTKSSTLEIGSAADPAEREADQFADGLLRDLGARPVQIHRQRAGTSADPLGGTMAGESIEGRIRAATGGRALPDSIRRAAEDRSGRDLSAVRVHQGAEADELSSSIDARAFATGHKIFLGRGSTDTAVLAHELGHVVQQGGGSTASRIRRSNGPRALQPLEQSGSAAVQRLFGDKSKKKPRIVDGVDTKKGNVDADQNNKWMAAERAKLRADIKSVEKTLTKLQADSRPKGKKAPKIDPSQAADLAATIEAAAFTLMAKMRPEMLQVKGATKLGITDDEVPRLKQLIAISQQISRTHTQDVHDRKLVQVSKDKAQQNYLTGGRQTSSSDPEEAAAGYKHLRQRKTFKDDLQSDATFVEGQLDEKERSSYSPIELAASIQHNGKLMGLSPAEIAAITVFTDADYKYINPVTANSTWASNENDDMPMFGPLLAPAEGQPDRPAGPLPDKRGKSWLEGNFPGMTPEQRAEMQNEGAQHAAMAHAGLEKLPVWKGETFRGEALNGKLFDDKFTRIDKATGQPSPMSAVIDRYPEQDDLIMKEVMETAADVTLRKPTEIKPTISSSTTKLGVTTSFSTPTTEKPISVLYRYQVTNGRDIHLLSWSRGEMEVATLPGATFECTGIELNKKGQYEVQMQQVK